MSTGWGGSLGQNMVKSVREAKYILSMDDNATTYEPK